MTDKYSSVNKLNGIKVDDLDIERQIFTEMNDIEFEFVKENNSNPA